MKKLMICMLVVFSMVMVGCENSYRETQFPVKPKELDDCKFFTLTNEDGLKITVVRCPNSQTSTSYVDEDDSHKTTVVQDGNTNE